MPAMSWGVQVLGAVVLHRGDTTFASRSPLLRTVLALVALRPGAPVGVAAIVDELWGEALPKDPRAALQVHSTRLRQWLEQAGADHGSLRYDHDGYVLMIPPHAVDAIRFAGAASNALRPLDDPAARVARCDAALREWHGEPFGGCVLGPRLEAEKVGLVELESQVREARIEALVEDGRTREAAREVQALLVHHPARERLAALAMIALYRDGRQREALAVFHDTRRHLAEEYGLEPGPALVRLEADILAHAPGLTAGAAAEVTPVPTPPRSRRRPLIAGREPELATIAERLRIESSPGSLVVVTGEAGCGKTTLAAAACADAEAATATTAFGSWDGDGVPLAAWVEALDELGSGNVGEPSAQVARTRRAVLAALAGAARDAPVLVVLEDAHVADSASLALVVAVARAGLPPGVVLVVTARDPDMVDRPTWLSAHADVVRCDSVVELHLGDLGRESVHAVASARLAHLPADAARRLGDVLWQRSGGHPLHLAALLDVMEGLDDEAACRAAAARVPHRLLPLIRYQLAALPAPCADLVQTLAVLGPTSPAALGAMRGASATDVVWALRPAMDAGLVTEHGDELHLRHALTHQAVLEVTPATTVHHLHLARLEDGERRGADPFTVLRHALGAGPLVPPARLAKARLSAAQVAYASGAHEEAVALLSAARPDLVGVDAVEADLHLGLALAALGRAADADDVLDSVVDRVDEHPDLAVVAAVGDEPLGLSARGDPRRLARLERVAAATAGRWSRRRLDVLGSLVLEETLVHGEVVTPGALDELRRLADHLDSDADRARLALLRARELVDASVPATTRLAAAEEAYELAAAAGVPVLRLDASELLMSAALAASQVERCLDLRWALAREAERVNRPRSIWAAQLVEAALLLAAGDLDAADERAQAALDAGTRLGIADAFGAYGVHAMVRRWLAGELPTLTGLVEQAVATYPRVVAWHAVAAAAYAQAGRTEDARRSLWHYLDRRIAGNRYFDRPGLCFATPVAVRIGDADAGRELRQALHPDPKAVVVVGVGAAVMGPLDLYVALAEHVTGDLVQAAANLQEARRTAAALGWTTWVDVCDRVERSLLHGPRAVREPVPL
jgi:DNA-binding SARP family transcriptional activator/RecA/RadA recombinase